MTYRDRYARRPDYHALSACEETAAIEASMNRVAAAKPVRDYRCDVCLRELSVGSRCPRHDNDRGSRKIGAGDLAAPVDPLGMAS